MRFAVTYHVEGPPDQPATELYDEIAAQVALADGLGFDFAWFAEHHGYVHLGHLPCPLLLALHLASRTKRIALGTAIICTNLHHPVDVAEQVAVADLLSGGRISPGFGSGCTPAEAALYGLPPDVPARRHERFEAALQVMRAVWAGERPSIAAAPGMAPLPRARPDLLERTWIAANSADAAGIAGRGGHNLMLSLLRTPEEYERLCTAYRDSGGRGSVAANRAVYVGETDADAWADAQPAMRILWRRLVEEGKLPRDRAEPTWFNPENVPGQFVVGGPATVAEFVCSLHRRVPFDTFNIQPRWNGFSVQQVHESLRRFAEGVMPAVQHLSHG